MDMERAFAKGSDRELLHTEMKRQPDKRRVGGFDAFHTKKMEGLMGRVQEKGRDVRGLKVQLDALWDATKGVADSQLTLAVKQYFDRVGQAESWLKEMEGASAQPQTVKQEVAVADRQSVESLGREDAEKYFRQFRDAIIYRYKDEQRRTKRNALFLADGSEVKYHEQVTKSEALGSALKNPHIQRMIRQELGN